MIIIGITLIVCLLGVLKFITWYKPRHVDYFVVFPYTLMLRKNDVEDGEEQYVDDLLNKLTKSSEVDDEVKMFNMRININMADVADYAEWTTSRFEDEKVYANATCVRFLDGAEMILNVPYDHFDIEFNRYLEAR
jgi:hypothetical protein